MNIQDKTIIRGCWALIQAESEQNIRGIIDHLQAFEQGVMADPELRLLVTHPQIKLVTKLAFVDKFTRLMAADAAVHKILRYLLTRRSWEILPSLINSLEDSFSTQFGIKRAKVTVIQALSSVQKQELATVLQKKFAAKAVEIVEVVEPAIRGGVLVEIDGNLIDDSLRHKLVLIEKELR